MERLTTTIDVALEPEEQHTRAYAYVDVETDRRAEGEVEDIMETVEHYLRKAEQDLRQSIN